MHSPAGAVGVWGKEKFLKKGHYQGRERQKSRRENTPQKEKENQELAWGKIITSPQDLYTELICKSCLIDL